MKKLILMLLVLAGGVVNVSADDYLPGSWNGWVSDTGVQFDYTSGTGTLTLNLNGETTYTFKVNNGGTWYGNEGIMSWDNCTSWTFDDTRSSGNDCTLKTEEAGNYVFTLSFKEVSGTWYPVLSVAYPNSSIVYFCNNVNWTQPYAYILGSSYWNEGSGSGSSGRYHGIAMSQVKETNIWKAQFPNTISTEYIAFLKDEQNNYVNFYQTEAVYKSGYSADKPLYVSSGTSSETKNQTAYYNTGEWHTYPAYTRSVTEGNFGTICLPFAATVTGATVFKIVSTVGSGDGMTGINLESVDALEAGKAYIFKATGSTLTATYSGFYTAASEANGMLGNLSSSDATVPEGNYVVSGNSIKKVVSGGTGVTVGQYKAYITLSGLSAAVRGLNFLGFDETTGIQQVESAKQNAEEYYNLAGQRVAQPTKGLYIVNGKKVIVK